MDEEIDGKRDSIPVASLKGTTVSDHGRWGKRWLAVILCLYLLLGGSYGIANPLFEAPDEQHHYATAREIARTKRLPIASANNLARQEAAQPPLYYLLAALVIAPLEIEESPDLWPNPYLQFSNSETTQNINAFIHLPAESWPWVGHTLAVHMLRFFSTLIGAGTVMLVYASGRLLWPREPVTAVLAAALVAFLPQFLFIHSAVNNDGLIVLLSTAVLWQLLRLECHGITMKKLFWLGLTIGLAILTKMTGLLLLPFALAVMTLLLWRTEKRRRIGLDIAFVSGIVVVLSGWLLWRNWSLYGDPTATSQFIALAGGVRPYSLSQLWPDLGRVWRSLIAYFGWMTVRAPGWLYLLWVGLGLLAGMGLLRRWRPSQIWRKRQAANGMPPETIAPSRSAPFWLAGWWLLVVAAWLRFMWQTPADQGRLWFPALLPMVLALAFGLSRLRLKPLPWVAAGVALVTALAGWQVIAQSYAPPSTIAAAALPASAQQLDSDMGLGMRLLAAELDTDTAVPGDHVWLTLFWQADTIPPEAPVVRVEALGRDYHLTGRTISYHGGGHFPANLWPANVVFVDRLSVRLQPTMATPAQVRLRVFLEGQEQQVDVGPVIARTPEQEEGKSSTLAMIGEGITLVAAKAPTPSAAPGDVLAVELSWRVEQDPGSMLTAFVHVGDPAQAPLAQLDAPPLATEFPPILWAAGDVLTDTFSVTLPNSLPNGRYPIHTGLYESASGIRLPVLVNGARQPHDAYLVGWLEVKQE